MPLFAGLAEAVAMLVLVWNIFDVTFHAWTPKTKRWFDGGNAFIKINPPRWLITLMWVVMYITVIASGYNYLVERQYFPGFRYDAVVVLFALACLMAKAWMTVFFKLKHVIWAMVIQALNLIILLVVMILMAVDEVWVSFGLILCYFVWNIYIGALNAYWIRYEKSEEGQAYYDLPVNSSERGGGMIHVGTTKKVGQK